MKAPHIRRVKSCSYCEDFHGNPKLITPDKQQLARKMPAGDYMCYQCQVENTLKLMGGKTS